MEQDPPISTEKFEEPDRQPSRQSFLRLVLLLLALSGLLAGSTGIWLWSYARSPGSSVSSEPIRIYIPPQTSFFQIKKILVDSHVIEDDIRFRLLARYLGASTRLKAGEYEFVGEQTPLSVLRLLEQGKTIPRSLTIAEGLNIYEVAQKIEEGGWGTKDDLVAMMSEKQFLKDLGLKSSSLEGYLFPDTYFFEKAEKPEYIVTMMVKRMQKVFAEECEAAAEVEGVVFDCDDQGEVGDVENQSNLKFTPFLFSINQVLTLASIVEKETSFAEERPLVAKVFINRLRKGMRLQADPTVVYGLKKFGGVLSKKDLRTPTPYNTYTQKGLPEGPICNPGRASISAVFNPSPDSYYYFVLQNGGKHYFSKSLKEHNRAVERLRKFEREK